MLNKDSLKATEGKMWKSAKFAEFACFLVLATNNIWDVNGTLMST